MTSEKNKFTFTEKEVLKKKDGFLIYDFSSLDLSGKPVWYFLAVHKSMSDEFLKVIDKQSDIDLSKYGAVLAHGMGDNAPEEARKEVLDKYQFNPNKNSE